MQITFLGADNQPVGWMLVLGRDHWDACETGHSLIDKFTGAVDFIVSEETGDATAPKLEHEKEFSCAAS